MASVIAPRFSRVLCFVALVSLAACGASDRSEPAAEPTDSKPPIVEHVQLAAASLDDLALREATVGVVAAEVVEVTQVAARLSMRTVSDQRSVCTLRIEASLAGDAAGDIVVPCSMPDRVLSEREAEQLDHAKEVAAAKGIKITQDPAAISYLPTEPWKLGTTSYFVLTPIADAGGGESHLAAPVTRDEKTGELVFAPGVLTRTDYPDFVAPQRSSVERLVEMNRNFVATKAQRDAEIQAAVDEVKRSGR